MSTVAVSAPAAGWYPDPAGQAALRYFDGATWTSQTRTPAPTVPTAAAADGAPRITERATGQVAAGWYPDPSGNPSLLRYHDGSVWTHKVAPAPRRRPAVPAAPALPTAAPAAPAPPQRSLADLRAEAAPAVDDDAPEDAAEPTLLERLRSPRAVGNLALVVGLCLSLSFFWDLHGSNFMTDLSQRKLQEQMAAAVPSASALGSDATPLAGVVVEETPVAAPSASSAAPAPTAVPSAAPAPVPAPVPLPDPTLPAEDGKPIGRIKIPSLGVDAVVVAGTTVPALKTGPGVWRDGAVPGMPGNATISGHRTTYGGPFRKLDQLKPGDRIVVSLVGHPDAVYEVRGTTIVEPSRIEVTENTPGVRLTLTTCDPVGSDAKRLVVQGELVEGTHADKALPASQWQVQS